MVHFNYTTFVAYDYCVVDGGRTPCVYGPCKTCGRVAEPCIRRCSNPTPSCGGKDCSGSSVVTRPCAYRCCSGKIILYIMNTYTAMYIA